MAAEIEVELAAAQARASLQAWSLTETVMFFTIAGRSFLFGIVRQRTVIICNWETSGVGGLAGLAGLAGLGRVWRGRLISVGEAGWRWVGRN